MPFSGIAGGLFSRIGGFLSPYLWYLFSILVGALGIVVYLYADEVEDHRETSSELAQTAKDYSELQELFAKKEEAAKDALKQVSELQKRVAELEEDYQQERDNAQEDLDDLMDRLRDRAKENEALVSRLNNLESTEPMANYQPEFSLSAFAPNLERLASARLTSEDDPLSESPVDEVEEDCPAPDPMPQERFDAICDTTPFSTDVVRFIDQRLRAIHGSSVQN